MKRRVIETFIVLGHGEIAKRLCSYPLHHDHESQSPWFLKYAANCYDVMSTILGTILNPCSLLSNSSVGQERFAITPVLSERQNLREATGRSVGCRSDQKGQLPVDGSVIRLSSLFQSEPTLWVFNTMGTTRLIYKI